MRVVWVGRVMRREREGEGKEKEYFTDESYGGEEEDEQDEEMDHRYDEEDIGDEEDDDIELEFLIYHSIGMQSIVTTTFLSAALEGVFFTLPYVGVLSLVTSFVDRKTILAENKNILREIGRDLSRRSLFCGIFFGSYSALAGVVFSETNSSDDTTVDVFSGMTAISLAAVSYRKPRLVLPSVGLLMTLTFFGLVP